MVATRTISTYDAKTHLSRILGEVEAENLEVIVTRHDRPIAKIIPFPQSSQPRRPGLLSGKIVVTDGWDEFTHADEKDWYSDVEWDQYEPGDTA